MCMILRVLLLLLIVCSTVQGGDWVSLPARDGALIKRHEATFVMSNVGAVLLGGRGRKRVNFYDPETDKWTRKRPSPEEIHHFQAVFHDGLIWIPSAWTGRFPFEANVDKFYVYNPKLDSWGTRTPMNESRRRGGGGVAYYEGKIYVTHGNRGGHGPHADTLGYLDVYDIATDSWRELPDAPNPRDHTGAAVVGGKICVSSGRNGGVRGFFNAVVLPTDCFDIGTETWSVEADLPTGRAGSAVGTDCNGKMMVVGGEGFGKAWNTVDYFDGKRWTPGEPLNEARHGSGLAFGDCNCGYVYIASGSGAQGGSPELRTTEAFVPSVQGPGCRPPTARVGLKLVAAGPYGPDGPNGTFVKNGDSICAKDFRGGFSLECVPAEGSAFVGRLSFFVDGNLFRSERVYPFMVAGDLNGSVYPWVRYPGRSTPGLTTAVISCEDSNGKVIDRATLTFGCV